jgi:drug/metabolite transporter (DMT)-like permease
MQSAASSRDSLKADAPDRGTVIAFVLFTILGGSNAVAVRISDFGLPPFFGAMARFAAAALIFWILVRARGIALPRGRTLVWVIVYGLLSNGVSYALIYWAILSVSPAVVMILLALSPLMTFFLALGHGLERFRWRGLLGSVIAVAGVLIAVGGSASHAPLLPVLAIAAGAAAIAEASVLLKRITPPHPVATNAVALSSGAALLGGISLFARESWTLPAHGATWIAFIYLVLPGTVVMFFLYLTVLARWTASATSYGFLLFPIVTIVLSALITGEVITPTFLAGVGIVLGGVWLGTIAARPSGLAQGLPQGGGRAGQPGEPGQREAKP